MGITHVLNTAEGSRFGQVDTGHAYYRDMPNVRYMGFPLMDQPMTDISRYFYIASKYIENAINSGGNYVTVILLNCPGIYPQNTRNFKEKPINFLFGKLHVKCILHKLSKNICSLEL